MNRLLIAGFFWIGLTAACVASAQDAETAEPTATDAVEVVERDPTVGWLVLSESLREGPIPYAWVAPADAGPSLDGVLDQLQTVAKDDAYLGLVIYLDRPELSLTQVTAMIEQIKAIRDSGKTVMAFSEEYGTLDYILASACDLILLQHKGSVQLMGLSVEEMYLKGLLGKIGAEADLLQTGQFKGADEQLTRDGPSEAWSANMDSLMDDLYGGMLDRIAEGRNMTREQVEQIIADSWTMDDGDYLRRRVVDRLCDRDLVDVTEIEFGDDFVWDDSMGEAGATRNVNSPFALFQMLFQEPQQKTRRPTIAVIHARGPITSGDSTIGDGLFSSDSIGSRTILKVLDDVYEDENIKGAVIRLDSPGGSALASEVIWQAVRELGQEKPVYISIGSMAASGGYYIACAADEIYIAPDSIVGSIGVVSGKIVFGGTYEKLGINIHRRSRGPLADMFNSVAPFTEEQRRMVRASMDKIYNLFVDRVKTGRGTRLPDVDAIDEGMLFTGRQAVKNGMADKLGNVDHAIRDLAGKLDLKDGQYDLMHLPSPISLQQYLSEAFGVSSPAVDPQTLTLLNVARSVMGDQAWRAVTQTLNGLMLLRTEPVLTLMPRAIVVR